MIGCCEQEAVMPAFSRLTALFARSQGTPPVDSQAPPSPVHRQAASPLRRRISNTALGLGIVAVGLVPFQRLLQAPSFEGVVKAPMITLRAPIDGEVEAGPSPPDVGAPLARGDAVFRIRNHRADRSRVDDLTRQIAQLRDERPGVAARLDVARALLGDLTRQTRLFAEARVLQLEVRQDELKAEVAAARAKNEEARASLGRFTTLAGKGWMPMSQLHQAQRDGAVAEMLEAAAQKRLEAVGVELAAAQRGVFVGIGSNDRPRYMQRIDQLEQQVGNLTETLAERDKRILRLVGELAEEKARHILLAEADVVAPAAGTVGEVLVVPGERVHRGQEMLRLLDCGRAAVTAVVGESVYDRLRIGSPAHFELHGTQELHPGRVVGLASASGARPDLAQPAAPAPESYYVTVAVPKLAAGQNCPVGRTGRVYFDDGAPEATAAAATDPRESSKALFRRAWWSASGSALN
jgi:multidrug resistance efflux pump